MADISYLSLLYEDFQMLQVIDPDKFDKNFADIKSKVNEMVTVLNTDVTELTTHKSSGDHDGRYFTETETNTLLLSQYNTLNGFINTHKTSTDHDSRYYTETEIDVKVSNLQTQITNDINAMTTHKASNDHDSKYYTKLLLDSGQLDNRYYTETEINSFLALKSNDNVVVKISGNQSIDGIKTFTSSPTIPTPISDMQASTKKYVDDNINTLQSLITNGTNNLNTHKSSSDHDSRYYSKTEIDNMTFKLSGDQTISGIKTFNLSPIVPNPINELDTANKIYVDSVCAGITQGAIADGSMTDAKLSDLDGQIKQRVSDVIKTVQDTTSLIIAGGTGTAITISAPSATAYVGYKKYSFLATANNAGSATTINLNGLGAIPLYKPGTTTAPSIIAGKAYDIWYEGGSFFLKASAEGNAVTGQVLAGSTFSNDSDTGLIGTMVNRGGTNLSPSTTNQPIPEGYYNGTGFVYGDADLVAGNIKTGVNIFGVNGTFTADANATAGQIITGQTAYVNGVKITGTMPRRIGSQATAAVDGATTAGRIYMRPPAGYYDGINDIEYADDPDFIAANILAGKNLFGLVGTAVDGANMKRYATGQMTAYTGYYTVTGLAFRPRIIWIKNDSSIHSGLVVNTDHNPQAFVLNGNVYKETTITASSFSIYNNIISGSTTWYAWE